LADILDWVSAILYCMRRESDLPEGVSHSVGIDQGVGSVPLRGSRAVSPKRSAISNFRVVDYAQDSMTAEESCHYNLQHGQLWMRKFEDSLRSKADVAMVNETLCKVLCHNCSPDSRNVRYRLYLLEAISQPGETQLSD
jgi:hypothetical protein